MAGRRIAEWSGFNLFVKLDGTLYNLAFQSVKAGRREFFESIPCLQASQ
jgi:hypothetical protein